MLHQVSAIELDKTLQMSSISCQREGIQTAAPFNDPIKRQGHNFFFHFFFLQRSYYCLVLSHFQKYPVGTRDLYSYYTTVNNNKKAQTFKYFTINGYTMCTKKYTIVQLRRWLWRRKGMRDSATPLV